MEGPAPSGDAARRFGTRDLLALNRWLCVTRLRSAGAVALFVLLAAYFHLGLRDPVAALAVCAGLAVCSLAIYVVPARVMASMATFAVQTLVDSAAITIGLALATSGVQALTFRPIYMMVVVPASLLSVGAGYFAAAVASAGHLLLLGLERGFTVAAMVSLDALTPVFLFFLVARQAFFYGTHLEEKNAALAALATRLQDSEQRLAAEGRRLATIAEMARTLGGALDTPEPLTRVSSAITERVGATWGAIFAVDPDGTFRLRGATDPEVDLTALGRIDAPLASWPAALRLRRGEPVVLDREESGAVSALFAAGRPLAAVVLTALYRDTAMVGFMAVGYAAPLGPLQSSVVNLLAGIAEHAAVVLQNARLLDEVRVASALKSEFVGAVSHELRSPLNAILGYLDMLLDAELGPVTPSQHDALARTRAYSLTLLEMITALLDLNRFEAGRLPIQRERADVGALLREVVDELPESWRRRGVGLRLAVEAGVGALETDRGKLKTIVRNLVHNALKFTAHGEVVLGARAGDGDVAIFVHDTGRGISADALPYVFDMFRQAPGSGGGGVGLGLHIVRRFADALGGQVAVTSEPGLGSRFTVTIPVTASAAARAA